MFRQLLLHGYVIIWYMSDRVHNINSGETHGDTECALGYS